MDERSLDMDSIEKLVDGARCAANRVADAHKKAKGLSTAFDELMAKAHQDAPQQQHDDWALYKAFRRLQAVEEEAEEACDEAGRCWSAVQEATVRFVDNSLARLADETTHHADGKAREEMRDVSDLVEKVEEKLRKRLKYFH